MNGEIIKFAVSFKHLGSCFVNKEGLHEDRKIRVTAELNVFAAMKMMFILWN